MHDRYMGTPAPNLLVLSRAGAAIARVSSGKPKKSRECALRDTNAAEVRSVHAQDGLMRRGGSAQTASRRICGSAIGPWHLYTHPGSGLHASGGVGAERTLNPAIDTSLR